MAPGGFRPAGGLACCGRLPPKLGSGVTVQRHLTRACAMAFEAHGAQQHFMLSGEVRRLATGRLSSCAVFVDSSCLGSQAASWQLISKLTGAWCPIGECRRCVLRRCSSAAPARCTGFDVPARASASLRHDFGTPVRIEQLAFGAGEEALGHGVVVAVSDGAHRQRDAGVAAALAEARGNVRAAFCPSGRRRAIAVCSTSTIRSVVGDESITRPTMRRPNMSRTFRRLSATGTGKHRNRQASART